MNILHINTADIGGGAEQAMIGLHFALVAQGHQSACWVGYKHSNWDFVKQLDQSGTLEKFRNGLDQKQGRELVEFPSIIRQVANLNFTPDIIHIHNLHGDYFNIRELPELSNKYKVVVHLHDIWLLTGHCAQSFDCPKWRGGCGDCPDLTIYPAIKKDATAFNWKRKRDILGRSRLHFVCPSQWIARQLRTSDVHYESHTVIPNGVDVDIFKAANKEAVRKDLGLEVDRLIVLFSAKNPLKNEFKDYATLEQAMKLVANELPEQEIELVCLGETSNNIVIRQFDNLTISPHSFTADRLKVAKYYQASDVYVHSTKAETFGKTIIEAIYCQVPVIAASVGGTPELVEHDKTGYLTECGNPEQLANYMVDLLSNTEKRKFFAQEAIIKFGSKFAVKHISKELIQLYEQLS